MRRVLPIRILVLVTVLAVTGLPSAGFAASDKNQDRSVIGQVLTKSDAPIPEAVVYLKNTKTLTIKSFITEKDGGYRFHGLSQNIDYEIYADYQGQKSSTKTISSFDTRNNITLNIHIDAK